MKAQLFDLKNLVDRVITDVNTVTFPIELREVVDHCEQLMELAYARDFDFED